MSNSLRDSSPPGATTTISPSNLTPEDRTRLPTDGDIVVVTPTHRTDDGVGVYTSASLFVVKELRAASIRARFLDDPQHRTFEAKKSAAADLIALSISVGGTLISNVAWKYLERLLSRADRGGRRTGGSGQAEEMELTVIDPNGPADRNQVTIHGTRRDVLDAVARLAHQPDPAPGLERSPQPPELQRPGARFMTAGSDVDLHEAYVTRTIDNALAAGAAALAQSKALLASFPTNGGLASAEAVAREGLAMFASALNWAEDTPREEEAHQELDSAGRWVRSTFGCIVHQEDGTYFETCPVKLGHVRVGFSVGGTATRTCSLCGDDVSECEHMRGIAYLVPGGITDLPWCRVCQSKAGCDHSPNEFYRVAMVAIITDMHLKEVSLVAKPAQPEARIHKRSIDTADLQELLGPEWSPGMPVNCDFCLRPCQGLVQHGETKV